MTILQNNVNNHILDGRRYLWWPSVLPGTESVFVLRKIAKFRTPIPAAPLVNYLYRTRQKPQLVRIWAHVYWSIGYAVTLSFILFICGNMWKCSHVIRYHDIRDSFPIGWSKKYYTESCWWFTIHVMMSIRCNDIILSKTTIWDATWCH